MNQPQMYGGPAALAIGGVAGWEGYRFERVEIAIRRGVPVLVGFGLRWVGEGDAPTLTAQRLAKIPARKLAALAAVNPIGGFAAGDVTSQLLGALGDLGVTGELPEYPRGGSPEFYRAVLEVFDEARARGGSGIEAVMRAWNVGRDRAKQYSANAHRWERAQARQDGSKS